MIRPNNIILKRIRILSGGLSTRILTIRGHLVNPETNTIIDCTPDYGKELSACLYGLVRDGYLLQLDEYHVALTDKGLHPYRQSWENVKHFLFNSVLVPIIASAITSLIVLWLQGLLQL
jgi:hypothetical protein